MTPSDVCLVGPDAPQPAQDYAQVLHAVGEDIQQPQEQIIALLRRLQPGDRLPLLTEVIRMIRIGCGIDLDNGSMDIAQEPSSFETQAPNEGPDGTAEGSKNGLNEAADLNTSVEGQGEPSEGHSQRAEKRKLKPADSEPKRPRLVLDKRENSESDDTIQSSSPSGSTEDTSDERQSQAENDRIENTQIELASTRSTVAAIEKTLREAEQSLFARYIELTYDIDRVEGDGDPQHTYYSKMAIDSFNMLRRTTLTTKKNNKSGTKILTNTEARKIIVEVFGTLFPNMFNTLVDALGKVQKTRASEHARTLASLPREEDPLPQGVLEVRGILDELEDLKHKKLKNEMRYLRLAVRVRIIHDAVIDPSEDISSIDPEDQSIITDIRNRALIHVPGQTTKITARTNLAKQLYRDETDISQAKRRLDDNMKGSRVITAMAQAFSIGCIWMEPKLHAGAWKGQHGEACQIFNIIKTCDPDGRVQSICQSLKGLTMAYTEKEPSLNVDMAVLDGLEDDPLSCITRLIEQEARVMPRIEDQKSRQDL